jgi:hypothetical protein
MACALSLGRIEPCKDVVGGIQAVYFLNYQNLTVTYDVTNTDAIDTLGSGLTAYKYELKGTSSFEQAITSSRDNGTTFFDQTLNLTLHKLSKQSHKEIKLMAYGRPIVIVEDRNSNFFVAGLEHGCEVTGGTIVTGAAMGDMSGYTLVLNGQEQVPANFLDGTLSAAGISTIVVGSDF